MEFTIFILLLILMAIAVYTFINKKQKITYISTKLPSIYDIEINDIDKMEGTDFELYLYQLLNEVGYRTYHTPNSRDYGADLVLEDNNKNRYVIQAKRYQESDEIGVEAVQQVFASKRFYNAKQAIVIATTKYTYSCETLAGFNNVKLICRNDLINIIKHLKQKEFSKIKNIIEEEPRAIYEFEEIIEAQLKNNIEVNYIRTKVLAK